MLEGSRPGGKLNSLPEQPEAWAGLGSLTLFSKASQPQGPPCLTQALSTSLSVYRLFISSKWAQLNCPSNRWPWGWADGQHQLSLASSSLGQPLVFRPHLLTHLPP